MGSGMSATNVQNKIRELSSTKFNGIATRNFEVAINRVCSISDGAKDISGLILSQVEESFPLQSDNNIKWIVQQIVHSICAAYAGLPSPNEQVNLFKIRIRISFYRCSLCFHAVTDCREFLHDDSTR